MKQVLKTKKYLNMIEKYPTMTDDEYRRYLDEIRRLKFNAHSYKRRHDNIDCQFLFDAIDDSDIYSIFDLNLKIMFFCHLGNQN